MSERTVGGQASVHSEGGSKARLAHLPKYLLPLVLCLAVVNLLLRLPFASSLEGTDTFYTTGFAVSINQLGRAAWLSAPLSYLGLPTGQPSAVPFLLSELSQLGSVDIVATNYLITSMLAIVGMLGMLCLALMLRRDFVSAFLAAAAFSLAPRFVEFTLNQASTRNLFVALTPVALLLVFKVVRDHRRRWTWSFLAEAVVVILIASHRIGILFLFVVLAIAIAIPFSTWLLWHWPSRRLRTGAYATLFAGLVLAQVLKVLPRPFILPDQYTTGWFFSGTSPGVILLNMAVDYGSSLGPLVLLMIVGTVHVARNPAPQPMDLFPLFSLLIFAPALVLGFYVYFALLAPLCLLIVPGLEALRRGRRISLLKQAGSVALAVALTSASALALLEVHGIVDTQLSPSVIEVSLYLRLSDAGAFASGDALQSAYRIWTVSGRPPVAYSELPLVIYGIVPPDNPFDARTVFNELRTGTLDNPGTLHLIQQYRIEVYVENLNMKDNYPLSQNLVEGAYVSFSNGAYAVWVL